MYKTLATHMKQNHEYFISCFIIHLIKNKYFNQHFQPNPKHSTNKKKKKKRFMQVHIGDLLYNVQEMNMPLFLFSSFPYGLINILTELGWIKISLKRYLRIMGTEDRQCTKTSVHWTLGNLQH